MTELAGEGLHALSGRGPPLEGGRRRALSRGRPRLAAEGRRQADRAHLLVQELQAGAHVRRPGRGAGRGRGPSPRHHLRLSPAATISLHTHKIKGLHENDFIMAAKIDRVEPLQAD